MRQVELVQRESFLGLAQPHQVWNVQDEIFQAVAIGAQSQIDQVYLFSKDVTDGLDQTLWASAAGFNGDNFRRDRLVKGAYLVSVERPLIAPVTAPLWVCDRFWPNRFAADGDRQSLQDLSALYSSQVVGSVSMFPAGGVAGVANGLSLALELELHRRCPPFLPTKRPPAVVVAEVNNGGGEWAGANEQVVCAIASLGRGAAEFSLALDNPGAGTYIFRIYGVNYLSNDLGAVESSNWTQLLQTVTYAADNQFEVYNAVGHFDAYVICGRNSAGADTARGVFMIKVRDVD